MTEAASFQRPNYGIDAPPVIRNLLLGSAAGFVTAAVLYLVGSSSSVGISLAFTGLGVGVVCLLLVGSMIYHSKVGKLRSRERLMDLIPWRGDEMVLDVGCGRGLLLIAAAKRLTTGKAVGVDIWQNEDLSGNHPEAARQNARLEGVAERVEVRDGDARQLPFPDATFDVVVSSLALHNIYEAAPRQQAVREIARVLKPGGHLALVDIRHTGEYVRVLRDNGVNDARRWPSSILSYLNMLLTWGSVQTYWVGGTKRTA
jgi:SAM-dependent methyltransferase